MDKPRLLAITKADLLDAELKEMIASEVNIDIPFLFISSVAQIGIQELKDTIWKMMDVE